MAQLAEEKGISQKVIARNVVNAFHELPETLPFKDKTFVPRLRTSFLRDYWMQRDRMLYVLPGQMGVMTEKELVLLYNSFLSMDFKNLNEIFSFWDISEKDLKVKSCVSEEYIQVSDIDSQISKYFNSENLNSTDEKDTRINILLLDLTHFFSDQLEHAFTGFAEPPLGLMYLSAYLKKKYPGKVKLKVIKSYTDFDNYDQLKEMINTHSPHLIGIRAMSFFQNFLHETIAQISSMSLKPSIIVGGPHATSFYSEILEDSNVDMVVIGEGEETFTEIVGKFIENLNKKPDNKILKKINGIAIKSK